MNDLINIPYIKNQEIYDLVPEKEFHSLLTQIWMEKEWGKFIYGSTCISIEKNRYYYIHDVRNFLSDEDINYKFIKAKKSK